MAVLRFCEIDAALHTGAAVEAAGVDIGELGDGEAVESRRQVVEIERLAVYAVVVFPFQHSIEKTEEGDGGEGRGDLADEAAPGGHGGMAGAHEIDACFD